MKNIKIFGVALAALTAGFTTSCTEDFLTVTHPTQVVQSDYYKTEKDINEALTAAYAPIHWEDYSWGWGNNAMISDMMGRDLEKGGENAGDRVELLGWFDHNLTSRSVDLNRWFGLISYSGVNRTCHVLDNLDNIQGLSQARKDQIWSEATVMRTYYYYNLWRFYGNVPYYESNLTFPYTTRQFSADEVYAACIAALDAVKELNALPMRRTTSDYGRVSMAMVMMLKARFVMFQMDQSKFGEVLADMKSIITSGDYALFNTPGATAPSGLPVSAFEALFMDAGEWSSETIFDINNHDQNSTTGWGAPSGFGGSVLPQWSSPRGLSPNDEFRAGWGAMIIPVETYNAFDPADTRRDASILNFDMWATAYAETNDVAKPTQTGSYLDTGFFQKKYINRPGYNIIGSGNGDANMSFRNNIRIFRFAETLLNAAELILRTGGSQAEAQGYYDLVRERAFGNSDHNLTVSIQNLIDERRWEFICEGVSYWDLVRTGQAEAILGADGWQSNATINGVKRWLWPIPQDEMDADSDLRQPGDFVSTTPAK